MSRSRTGRAPTAKSKYGNLDRALVGIPDLLGVWWLRRRSKARPVAADISERVDG